MPSTVNMHMGGASLFGGGGQVVPLYVNEDKSMKKGLHLMNLNSMSFLFS